MPPARWVASTCSDNAGDTARLSSRGALSSTVTRLPNPSAVAATSSPMKPPPSTVTCCAAESMERSCAASSAARSSATFDSPTSAGSRRARVPVASTSRSQPSTAPERKVTVRARTVDRQRRIAQVQRDAGFGIPGLGAMQLRRLLGALEKGLGERRAVVGDAVLLAHQVHAGALPRLGQAGAQLRGGVAAADDHDVLA